MLVASGSGSGKTTITCGLIAYYKKLGKKIKSYKCGPDYIDPMFHRSVLGVAGGNIDSYFTDESILNHFFDDNEEEVTIIEGVMGIYDGLGTDSDFGSSYDIARKTKTPIVLILDTHGMGRTLLSVLKGILLDDDGNLIKGVIFNRMSEGFYAQIKDEVNGLFDEMHLDTKVLGVIPKINGIGIDSRHLGLILPEEISDLHEKISKVVDILEKQIDLQELDKIMSTEIKGKIQKKHSDNQLAACVNEVMLTKPHRIAIARDEAFCFYYEENLDLLRKKGVDITFFSPLHDLELPKDIDGFILGGGYPELYLDVLSNNESMRTSIKVALEANIPSLAECGGFMYLHDAIIDDNGNSHPMVGAISGTCEKKERLVRFGYMYISDATCNIEIQNDKANPDYDLAEAIVGLKGHEFHYFDSTNNGTCATASKPNGSKSWECLHIGKNHVWGFPHFYYLSNIKFIDVFLNLCDTYKDSKKC